MAAPGVSVPSWREVMGSGRGRLSAGLALTEFVAGMQSLVVVAAMPRVLRDLGGVEFYGTVFSGYFLSGLVSIPPGQRDGDQAAEVAQHPRHGRDDDQRLHPGDELGECQPG